MAIMKIPKWLEPSADFTKELFREFAEDNSGMMAAAVSFYVFLSLAPLLLLAMAAFGYILQSQDQAYQAVLSFVHNYSPALAEGANGTVPLLQEIIKGSGAATGIGLVALFWAGSQAFVNLEMAINTAWDAPMRGFVKSRLIAIIMLLIVGLLLVASFGITAAASAVRSQDYVVFGRSVSDAFGLVWNILLYVLPIGFSILTFTLIYKVLPNVHVHRGAAFAGGTVAGLLWEIAKYGFSWYVNNIANYSAVYGSLAGIILLLVWINYSSLVTILGAQIGAIYYKRNIKPYEEK